MCDDLRSLNIVVIIVLAEYDERILSVTEGLGIKYWALFSNKDGIIFIVISTTKMRTKDKWEALTNFIFRCVRGWKIIIFRDSVSVVKTQRLEK